jgi:hypothetical protein
MLENVGRSLWKVGIWRTADLVPGAQGCGCHCGPEHAGPRDGDVEYGAEEEEEEDSRGDALHGDFAALSYVGVFSLGIDGIVSLPIDSSDRVHDPHGEADSRRDFPAAWRVPHFGPYVQFDHFARAGCHP